MKCNYDRQMPSIKPVESVRNGREPVLAECTWGTCQLSNPPFLGLFGSFSVFILFFRDRRWSNCYGRNSSDKPRVNCTNPMAVYRNGNWQEMCGLNIVIPSVLEDLWKGNSCLSARRLPLDEGGYGVSLQMYHPADNSGVIFTDLTDSTIRNLQWIPPWLIPFSY